MLSLEKQYARVLHARLNPLISAAGPETLFQVETAEFTLETVELQLGGNHLRVQSGPFTMTTKLVDGQFPDYEKVVPSDGSRFLTGDRETLRQAFQRASILSNEKYRGVRMIIGDEQLTKRGYQPVVVCHRTQMGIV